MNLKPHVQACARHANSSSDHTTPSSVFLRKPGAASLALLLVASAWAQSTGSTPTYVPRYDKNGDGRLDPEEVAAMQADQAKAAAAVVAVPGTSGEIVTLSPFEVVDNNRGYYAAKAMS